MHSVFTQFFLPYIVKISVVLVHVCLICRIIENDNFDYGHLPVAQDEGQHARG